MQKQDIPTYLKAITIRDPSDLHSIAEDIKKGMILILRVTPLAQKDVEKLRKVVEELYVIQEILTLRLQDWVKKELLLLQSA